ncbi:hypothetical protein SZN_04766 [Streptomyces zinciresistens K42]|uniref:Uncharacterized protein n=1 Tax=Streptomyces zinciresistens K42 TaxID=700597 RepID=G2G647_9ACTN|nr:hypothetical protein SZN_04766 [Streptomyces zinciresistens K42]
MTVPVGGDFAHLLNEPIGLVVITSCDSVGMVLHQ